MDLDLNEVILSSKSSYENLSSVPEYQEDEGSEKVIEPNEKEIQTIGAPIEYGNGVNTQEEMKNNNNETNTTFINDNGKKGIDNEEEISTNGNKKIKFIFQKNSTALIKDGRKGNFDIEEDQQIFERLLQAVHKNRKFHVKKPAVEQLLGYFRSLGKDVNLKQIRNRIDTCIRSTRRFLRNFANINKEKMSKVGLYVHFLVVHYLQFHDKSSIVVNDNLIPYNYEVQDNFEKFDRNTFLTYCEQICLGKEFKLIQYPSKNNATALGERYNTFPPEGSDTSRNKESEFNSSSIYPNDSNNMLHNNSTNSNCPSNNTSNMLNNMTSSNLLPDTNCNENNTILDLPNNHVNNGLNLSNLSNVNENRTVNSIDGNATLNKVNGNITSNNIDNINKEKVDLMIKLLEAQERVLDKAILLKDKEIKLKNLQLVFDDNKKVGENNHNSEQQLNFISNLSLNSNINLAALNKLNDI